MIRHSKYRTTRCPWSRGDCGASVGVASCTRHSRARCGSRATTMPLARMPVKAERATCPQGHMSWSVSTGRRRSGSTIARFRYSRYPSTPHPVMTASAASTRSTSQPTPLRVAGQVDDASIRPMSWCWARSRSSVTRCAIAMAGALGVPAWRASSPVSMTRSMRASRGRRCTTTHSYTGPAAIARSRRPPLISQSDSDMSNWEREMTMYLGPKSHRVRIESAVCSAPSDETSSQRVAPTTHTSASTHPDLDRQDEPALVEA